MPHLELTNCVKSSNTVPSWSSRQSFPSFPCANIPSKRNRSPARPRSCLVDLSYLHCIRDEWIKKRFHTVSKCWRSREGMVEGEKWSFLNTVCLIMLKRLRMARTLESAEPYIDKSCLELKNVEKCEVEPRRTLTVRTSLALATNATEACQTRRWQTSAIPDQGIHVH